MDNPVLHNSKGELACSYCGSLITASSWKSATVRGYFDNSSCRDTATTDADYAALYPRKVA